MNVVIEFSAIVLGQCLCGLILGSGLVEKLSEWMCGPKV